MGERARARRRFGCELNGFRDTECQESSMPSECPAVLVIRARWQRSDLMVMSVRRARDQA